MLDLQTPLSKCSRVSRKIPASGFIAHPGLWIKINIDGSSANVATGVAPLVAKLCIGTHSTNGYENNDVEVGRITTLETIGARCTVDSTGFHGTTFPVGWALTVDAEAGYEGKLKLAGTGDTIVAITEGYTSTTGLLTYVTADPTIMPATTTAAPTTTTTSAP